MGLRLLPWVLGMRRKHKTPKLFDCETCMSNTTIQHRRRLNCGWLSPSEHVGPGAEMPVTFFPDPDVSDDCPGWLIRLPAVHEAQIAYYWTEKSLLRERYPGDENLELLMDCVQVLGAEQAALEERELAEMQERSK